VQRGGFESEQAAAEALQRVLEQLRREQGLDGEFADGAWVVEFARAGGAADAVRLLAHAFDVRGSDPLARLTSRLRDASTRRCRRMRARAGRGSADRLVRRDESEKVLSTVTHLGQP